MYIRTGSDPTDVILKSGAIPIKPSGINLELVLNLLLNDKLSISVIVLIAIF